ncbi:DUF1835 domain-containing protein [Algoriphagus zhangzhouensis]|uniref:DUF1835 domain-containing protein n=1 Tax=Algoriphagus zhangzhouensis TaxID=1073327 RepID=A0A1M7ZH98_9BACT|nr:DUF1835 domain-containing protein [Algoriphagus zhangzhouensis]TDY44145.1 uncharacterized protein DUF1835 [Algoriphagus zhangzhouensis]SHO64290.1 protein of unknown function [Algoriphagus zhangzhouensis]
MNFHILNGDSLSQQFPKEISGEKIIFRECLVDGPVKSDSEDDFWNQRRKFIEAEFQEANYDSYSKAEILKISEIPEDSKVHFWFEEDLFCQVNFWKACTLLPPSIQSAFLVMPGSNSPYSFAHLSNENLISQWENAVELNSEDLELFQSLWKSFQNSDPEEALQSASNFEEIFSFLIPAIKAWKEMIPNENSEGLPKEELKKIHQELQTENFGPVFREFHRRLPIYGLGDTQVLKLWQSI